MHKWPLGLPQGVGVGLRTCHYATIEAEKPTIPWFEVLSDNYFCDGGPSLAHLEKICSLYPVTLHGVGMSIGSTDPLDQTYLNNLKKLIRITQPLLVSDHLCWTSLAGQQFHELLPLPYTDEAVKHVSNRIRQVQDFLERRIMIENVSSYLTFKQSTLTEWAFLQAVADEADCQILLDINNIYVSAFNHGFDAHDYIKGLNTRRIQQFHLAGFEDRGTYLFDTHGAPIYPQVWELFVAALKKFGPMPTIIERDNDIPAFSVLQQEAETAQKLMDDLCNPYKTFNNHSLTA